MRILGIDATSSPARALITDESGTLLAHAKVDTPPDASPQDTWAAAARAVKDLGETSWDTGAIGLPRLDDSAPPDWQRTLGPFVRVDERRQAFLAASPEPDGALLLAGREAVAVRFKDWEPVATANGLPFPLGGEGSLAWLGWRAVQAVGADLDRRGRATDLTPRVISLLGLSAECPDLLERFVEALRPDVVHDWSRFAHLVIDLDEIDRVSSLILDEAAKPLATEARLMGGMSAPIVLAGQALATGGLGLRLAEAFPTCAIATYPVVGSAFAAARAAGASLDRDTLCAALADADGEQLPESSYRPSTLGDWGGTGGRVRPRLRNREGGLSPADYKPAPSTSTQ